MRRFLLIAALAAFLPATAHADSDVPTLAAGTSLTSAAMYLANAGANNNKLGLTTSVFDISAGALTLKAGGVSDAMLASTFLKTSALGTGVATALGVNVGTAGAFLKNNGDVLSGTYSGDFALSGTTIQLTGIALDTQDRCLGLTGADVIVYSTGACGSGGGGGTITSVTGTNGVTASTTTGAVTVSLTTPCPVGIDTWDGTTDKTISASTGLLYTTPGTPVGAARVLTLPAVSTWVLSCPLTVVDQGAIFNSSFAVTPTRAASDTIDGANTGTDLGCSHQAVIYKATVAGKWATVSPPSLCTDAAVSNQFVTAVPDTGIITRAQPAFTNISGVATAAQLPAATTSAQGAALLHNVPFSMGWNSATNPDGNFVAVVTQASRITAIKGRIGPAVGTTATIIVKKAASGVACAASGTALHSGSFDANGTANTVQTLTLVGGATDDLAAGDTVCFSTADGAAFLGGVGKGVISIDWAPL
jgi:hypothetical protein